MELCEGTLSDLVLRASQERGEPGLPPLDITNLGLMLCSALHAVHHSARCLHLGVTPSNVLLSPATHTSAAELRSVRLSDPGLSGRLPARVRASLVTAQQPPQLIGVAGGVPGYAPKEQLLGQGEHRSDVYGMGATLLYAASAVHARGGHGADAAMSKPSPGAAWLWVTSRR